MDTKKKELIGQHYNKGRRWRPGGNPEKVKVHDFIDPDEPKAIPYGVYDVARNQGWVSVGCDHDTASFAVGEYSPLVERHGEPRVSAGAAVAHLRR